MNTPIPLPRLGIDLLSDETQMPAGTVRAAVNVDIDKRGQFARRQGSALTAPGGYDDLYPWGKTLLARRGGLLLSIDPATMTESVLCDLGADSPVDYTVYNGNLYIASATVLWTLRGDAAYPAGSRLPDSLPDISPTSSGALTSGRYMAAISMIDERGEESPAVPLGQRDVTAGLQLTGLEITPGSRWRLYLTPPDGDVLYLAEEFDAVFSQYAVTVYPGGAPCDTLHLAPMPGGHFVRGYNGRLFVAAGDTLWFSEPLRPHLTAPRHNFIRFVGQVRFVEFVAGGAFVGDDRGVWWLAGDDPSGYRQQHASDAVAVARSSALVPSHHLGVMGSRAAADCAVWLSADGYMVGSPGGQVTALHSDRIRLAPQIAGRSIFLVRDGIKQIVTLTASPGPASVFGGAIDTATH